MKSVGAALAIAVVVIPSIARADSIRNWPAPSTWTPPSARTAGRDALAAYPPLPFIPLTPCRLVDTRGNAPLTGGFLPPATVRSYTLTGVCGLPPGAQAVSLNATVVDPTGPGFLTLYPQFGAFPPVSTLNYLGHDVVVNAAVVPLSPAGGISMALGVSGGDVILDVNGYYTQTLADPSQYLALNTNNTYAAISLSNQSTNCPGPCGLQASVQSGTALWGATQSTIAGFSAVSGVASQGALGVLGFSSGYLGVLGSTDSSANDVEGVLGQDGTGAGSHTGILSAGVRGEGRTGVVGLSSIGGGAGVIGLAYGSGGVGVAGEAESPATTGVEAFGNLVATGAKPFVEPHPTDPTLTIRYVALEGPEAGTYFRGTARTVGGEAVIPVPESFRIVTAEEGITVQLTTVGGFAQMTVMSEDLDRIVVHSTRDVTFHYQVNGVRRAFKDWQVVTEGIDFRPASPDQKMPSWLTEEAKRRLVANGTYNPDGTVNMSTAERLGWAQAWREAAAARAASHP